MVCFTGGVRGGVHGSDEDQRIRKDEREYVLRGATGPVGREFVDSIGVDGVGGKDWQFAGVEKSVLVWYVQARIPGRNG